jgi:hypothetical protein
MAGPAVGCDVAGSDAVTRPEQRVEVPSAFDLLVAQERANRQRAHSHPSWLERCDAAVLQGVDELGQVREQRSRQCRRLAATPATKLDDGRLSRGTHREERSEIRIRGDDDSVLGGSALEDHFVVS